MHMFMIVVPTKDQALQQVVLLKKELFDLKAAQAVAESAHVGYVLQDPSDVTRQTVVN